MKNVRLNGSQLKSGRMKQPLFFLAVCCLLSIICVECASFTFAKFVREEGASFSARVAVMRMGLVVTTEETVQLDNTVNIERSTEHPFTVSRRNKDNEETEVAYDYTIELKLPRKMPDFLGVYLIEIKDGVEESPIEGKEEEADSKVTFAKTFRMALGADNAQFKLKFTVDPLLVFQSETFTGIEILVHAEQAEGSL